MIRALYIISMITLAACSRRQYVVPFNTMEPTITNGQPISASFKAYERSTPARNDIVLYVDPIVFDQLWLGRIMGVPGDSLIHDSSKLLINGAEVRIPGSTNYYSPQMTNGPSKFLGTRSLIAGEYYILVDNTAAGVDSRHFGIIAMSNVVAKVLE